MTAILRKLTGPVIPSDVMRLIEVISSEKSVVMASTIRTPRSMASTAETILRAVHAIFGTD